MDRIAMLTVSHKPDVLRVKFTLNTYQKFNVDNIPWYIAVPQSDIAIFQNHFIPIASNFKIYHEKCQLQQDRKLGLRLQDLARVYLGVNLQSNWFSDRSECFNPIPYLQATFEDFQEL